MIERLLKNILAVLIGLHFAALIYVSFWAWNQVHFERFIPEKQRFFTVANGSSLNQVLEDLSDQNLAPPPVLVRCVLAIRRQSILVKKGTYQLPERASTWRLLELLDQGLVVLHRITVPEGLDKWEVASLLGTSQWGTRDTFQKLIDDPHPITSIDPEATDLEGYLFPETYYFEASTTPEEIIGTLIREFLKQTKSLRKELEARGENLRQWLTLASLVEEESAVASERATIAGVFAKRLKRGMLLQCDPTIIYSLKLKNRFRGKIYRSDIRFEHPYNTYTTPGLPAGPICSPGKASLTAALNPIKTPYLYFVARNDGTHYFSKSLREHNRAVRKYQR